MTDSTPTPPVACGSTTNRSHETAGRITAKYLVRVGYCYPAVTSPGNPPGVLLYAPSACDESLPAPELAPGLVPGGETQSANRKFAKFVVTDIKSPDSGQHCDSASVALQPPQEIEGPSVPPATSQLVCVAPK